MYSMLSLQDHPGIAHFPGIRMAKFYSHAHFPRLKGKASWMMSLAPALLWIFEQFMDETDVTHRWVHQALRKLCRLDVILQENREYYALPVAAAKEFRECVFAFLALNTALGKHFHDEGETLFNTTIKFHYLAHIGLNCSHLNPTRGWCYEGESLLKHIKRLVAKTAYGTSAVDVNNKVLENYCQGMHVTLQDGTAVLK